MEIVAALIGGLGVGIAYAMQAVFGVLALGFGGVLFFLTGDPSYLPDGYIH